MKTAGTAVVMVLALTWGRSAAAQTRGMLQAGATVIDTRVSTTALTAVAAIVRTASGAALARPITDRIAIIRIDRPKYVRRVVVTIDYSRN